MQSIHERIKAIIGTTRTAGRAKVKLAGLAGVLVGTMMLGSGCAHTLEVKNIRSFENVQSHSLQKPLIIGVAPTTDDVGSHQLMKGIETALGRYSPTVTLPPPPGNVSKADVIANINIHSGYKGSGWNFLINFPGFLIFTPAWNGYVYKANYNVDISLAEGIHNNKIDAWSLPVNLDLRQAEFDRTWTEVSWLEVGAIAFIGGIVFTAYDTDVTPILGEKIENPIGDYIAQDIVNHINRCTNLVVSTPRNNSTDSSPLASGTGFFISEDGFIVTCAHVVKDSTKIDLLTSAGQIPAEVVKVDSANDLALLKAKGKFSALSVISSSTVKLGSTVATVGFPNLDLQGFAPKLAKGEIASLSGIQDDARDFQISVPVQPGNSGGALVDELGNVVGIVAAKLNPRVTLTASGSLPENVNYAVKSSFLLSFLESVPDVSGKLKAPNTSELKFEDVVKSTEQATVLVLVY